MENELLEKTREWLKDRKFTQLYQMLKEMQAADIAILFDELELTEIRMLFRLLPKTLAAETFVEMDSETQEALIAAFNDKELQEVMDELFIDDTVDIIEEMPANVVKRMIRQADPETRRLINEILNYPSDSAGSIMTIEFVDLHKSMTVTEAFEKIRRTGLEKETVYTCYVINGDRRLEGIVTVQQMLLASWDSRIEEIMETNVISVATLEDREEVANKLNKYNFLALPVVDNENRLVGIVTFDDAIDVLKEEATEDIEIMAALVPSDKPYLKTGVFETWLKRIPWLLLLMISATFTGQIILSFENQLAACAVLTAFIPMLMDTGGNAGGQSSVTIIRGLSLHEIEYTDVLTTIWKELRVALLCGISLAAANFIKMIVVDQWMLHNDGVTPLVAFVVCLTMVVTICIAKVIGCTLPIAAKRIGFDPAVMASPFITTIVDALSLLTYFQIAKMLLPI